MYSNQPVIILSGRFKGNIGFVLHETTSNIGSKDKAMLVRVKTFRGWRTLKYNFYNLLVRNNNDN